jgi:hypothetical protein
MCRNRPPPRESKLEVEEGPEPDSDDNDQESPDHDSHDNNCK